MPCGGTTEGHEGMDGLSSCLVSHKKSETVKGDRYSGRT